MNNIKKIIQDIKNQTKRKTHASNAQHLLENDLEIIYDKVLILEQLIKDIEDNRSSVKSEPVW